MKNIRLTIQFVGTNYHGWQRQNNAKSVQAVLEDTIGEIIGEKIVLFGCGRTDSGVHAKNYVCNFQSDADFPFEKLHFRLNDRLPLDIRVLSWCYEDPDFHSRFSAKSKTYTYVVYNDKQCDVFMQGFVWHNKKKLDFELIKEAAKHFVGTHDFRSFMVANNDINTTVRTIYELDVKKDGKKLIFTVTADGFLYNMVRIIVGTICDIGSGKISLSSLDDIILACDRTKAGVTAPASGLYLEKAVY